MRALVVKLTAGEEEPERASQAFTIASTAVASGVEVSMWLTGDAVFFALPGAAEAFDLPHGAPLAGLRDAILSGGTLTACTQCLARRDISPEDLMLGVLVAGAASFVEQILTEDTQALVY